MAAAASADAPPPSKGRRRPQGAEVAVPSMVDVAVVLGHWMYLMYAGLHHGPLWGPPMMALLGHCALRPHDDRDLQRYHAVRPLPGPRAGREEARIGRTSSLEKSVHLTPRELRPDYARSRRHARALTGGLVTGFIR